MKPLLPRRVDGQGEKGEITVSRDAQRAYVHDGKSLSGLSLRDFTGHGVNRVHDDILVQRSAPQRIIVYGDSITQTNSYSGIPDGSPPRDEIWTQGYGYAEQSIFRSLKPYRYVRNAGIAGQTTAQILARLNDDVLVYKPDVVLLMAGTNDILAGQVDQSYTNMMSNIELMVVGMMEQGCDVILATPPTKDSAPDETRMAIQFFYMLADYYNLPLLDTYKITVNPQTGMYKDGYSEDGVHPNPVGIDAIAVEGAKVLAEPWKYTNPTYLAAVSEATVGNRPNLIGNGAFALPPSPIDGTTLQAWDVGVDHATFTWDTAAALPWTGNNFVYTQGAGAGGGQYALYGSGISTGYKEGDVLVGSLHLKTTGLTVASAQGFTWGFGFDNGDNARLTNSWPYNAEWVLSQEIIVPKSPGNLIPSLYVQDVGVYTVNNVTLWNRTAAEAIWKPGQL